MQQSATGAPAVTANASIAAGNNVKPAQAPPPQPQPQPPSVPQSSMDHSGNISVSSSRANSAMKDVDGIHFTSSQQATVTTTAAPVITVVAPSTQSTDMISSQPVVVQVSSGNQYIVAVSSDNNANGPSAVAQPTVASEDPEEAGQPHTTYEDYNSVYSNGSNSAGQMTYYTTDTYSQAYYNAGVNLTDTAYLVMEQPTANANDPSLAVAANCNSAHRDSSQNVLSDDEYNKSYQTTRMSVQPQTITWLMQNYETADGVSLPRSTLYSHYQTHCQQNNIEPVNAASFGKLIRSVFVGLRTRRLGTRGNSKYHYYGIRIKPGSSLARIGGGEVNGNVENSTMPPVKRAKVNNLSSKSNSVDAHNALPQQNISSPEALVTYLGDPSELLNSVWPSGQNNEEPDESQKVLHIFTKIYRAHYDKIIKALSTLNFQEVEIIWTSFWQCTSEPANSPDYLNMDCVKQLTKTSFADWIAQTDYTMYNAIISNLLLPNLLKPIPQILTQQIRNFAKCINKWMVNALHGYEDEFIQLKTAAVSALSHMLRRYTSLNHLSTAACAVLKNQQQVNQMISDLNKVDFKNVQEQASWVCQCDDDIVRRVENSFKTFLTDHNPHEKWASWCERVLQICLPDDTIPTAKQFFFKWEFYSSLVMRDLTLRSAASFGSFHLIRLLYDEYIFYLIEQRIAKATRTTPLQMLGESRSLNLTGHLEPPQQPSAPNAASAASVPNSNNSLNNESLANQQQQQALH